MYLCSFRDVAQFYLLCFASALCVYLPTPWVVHTNHSGIDPEWQWRQGRVNVPGLCLRITLAKCTTTQQTKDKSELYLTFPLMGKETRSSADADKLARRCQRSVKVTKHSTSTYVRYSFPLVWNSKFVFEARRFSHIRLQKCCDLEIRVIGHSRSLKVVTFDRLDMVSY